MSQLAYITPNADVTQNSPVPVSTVVYKGLTYYKYTLPGTYTFSQADTFRFEVSSTHASIDNCNNTEKLPLDIIVKDISNTALFNYTPTGCLPDLVKFRWDSTNAGEYHFNKWLWTFPDNTTANKPWDGGGLPVGVYYYVIDLQNGSGKLAGYVTLLK